MPDDNDFNRTDLAEDRTIMAVERTFAGWMRTSFAAIGIGLAFKVLFGELEPPWLARVIATIFILLAAFLAITAERRACRAVTRMKAHSVDAPDAPHLRYVAWAVAAGSSVLAVAIWLMRGASVPIPRNRLMQFDDLLVRFFGTSDMNAISPAAREAGVERMRVDFGLERDPANRFAIWALLAMNDAEPDLAVAFDNETEREAARNLLDLVIAAREG